MSEDASIYGAFTFSVQDRVCARVRREMVAKAPRRPSEKQREELEAAREASIRDEWLTSIERARLGGMCRVEDMRVEVEEWERVMSGYERLYWRVAGNAASLALRRELQVSSSSGDRGSGEVLGGGFKPPPLDDG